MPQQFQVKILDAILTHNTEIGSNMDPFCVLKYGSQQQKTKILDEGGDMPVWNQAFTFNVGDPNELLNLTVFDEDMAVDDLIGQVSLSVKSILQRPKTDVQWYSLKYGPELKKPAGKIHLQFEVIGGFNGRMGYGQNLGAYSNQGQSYYGQSQRNVGYNGNSHYQSGINAPIVMGQPQSYGQGNIYSSDLNSRKSTSRQISYPQQGSYMSQSVPAQYPPLQTHYNTNPPQYSSSIGSSYRPSATYQSPRPGSTLMTNSVNRGPVQQSYTSIGSSQSIAYSQQPQQRQRLY